MPSLASFGEPMAVMGMGEYEAMKKRITELEGELRSTKSHLKRLGYDFVGTTIGLIIEAEPGRSPFDQRIIVRVPEIKVRAESCAVPPYLRGISMEEIVIRHAQAQENAIRAAMTHAGETWVRHFHDLAIEAAKRPAVPAERRGE